MSVGTANLDLIFTKKVMVSLLFVVHMVIVSSVFIYKY